MEAVQPVRLLRDIHGRDIRLTEERLSHIRTHPEMRGMEEAMEDTLAQPDQVVESVSDPRALLYYRRYRQTRVGDKFLCVVVKTQQEDAFLVTAYLTDKIKRGRSL